MCDFCRGRWSEKNGNGLHPLQLRIALHSAQLLRVGGRMVYSTCTFNPVEDEAVVAEVSLQHNMPSSLVEDSFVSFELLS